MTSTKNRLLALCTGVFAAALAACTSPNSAQCEATGVICPVNFHCAANEPVCISDLNLCGNLRIDPGEACDDGNTKDGDGCSADCTSNETCGNGVTDLTVGEVCDDGNTRDGDGCSHDCKSKELCGNKIVDFGEVCDDGNNNDGDGCSHDCKSTEACGNGVIDRAVGEVCDPPEAGKCSTDCRSSLQCGNKRIDPGEECDDGLADNGDDKDCRSDCMINRCGDGRPNTNGVLHHEDCDGGPRAADTHGDATPTETADCNIDCTTARCGDGKINHSFVTPKGIEQCDNAGGNNNAADCTADCQINVCGDNLKNTVGPLHIEGCDDGNRVDTDTCTNACIAQGCGDGIVGPGEECDLGIANSDTGACLTTCKIAKCGDGKVEAGVEQCDSTASCSSDCKRQECGNGIIDPGEECDNGTANNGNDKDCRADCIINRCGDGFPNTNGTHKEDCDPATPAVHGSSTVHPADTANCNIDCTAATCGDGKLNKLHLVAGKPEQCDNAASNNDNADCTSTCQTNVCGDNLKNTMGPQHTEACDDGNRIDTDACTNVCALPTCGDGIVDSLTEECDLGTANSDAGACLTNCHIAKCGDGKTETGVEQCDGGAGCSSDCKLQQCGNGIIDPGEECDNGTANNGNDKDCRADCIINRCGDGFVNLHGTHTEQCDDAPKAAAHSTAASPVETNGCNFDCTSASCGDGKINRTRGEQCDDALTTGNANNKDCTATCQRNVCGDGHPDTAGTNTEDCDTGVLNGTPGSACSAACTTQSCGNGVIDSGELCDNGNATGCGTCINSCQTTVEASAATGLLLASAGNEYTDGDSFTISDGLGTTSPHKLTFQFTNSTGAPPTGTVKIPFDTGDGASSMAVGIVNAINATAIRIAAARLATGIGLVTLTNRQSSSTGNLAITVTHLPASFFVSGGATGGAAGAMSGGAAGDCDNGIGCRFDADCKSNLCSTATNQCVSCTLNAQCASGHCVTIAGFGQCQE